MTNSIPDWFYDRLIIYRLNKNFKIMQPWVSMGDRSNYGKFEKLGSTVKIQKRKKGVVLWRSRGSPSLLTMELL